MISLERRYELINTRVTWDGHPAVISGAKSQFAVLRRLDGMDGAVEYAWETVERIIGNGGDFHPGGHPRAETNTAYLEFAQQRATRR